MPFALYISFSAVSGSALFAFRIGRSAPPRHMPVPARSPIRATSKRSKSVSVAAVSLSRTNIFESVRARYVPRAMPKRLPMFGFRGRLPPERAYC